MVNKKKKKIIIKKKVNHSKNLALKLDEFKSLEKGLIDIRHQVILILGGIAGMRVQEICQCRLTWLRKTELEGKEVLEINIPDEDKDTKSGKTWKIKNTTSTIYYDKKTGEYSKESKARTTYLFEDKYINIIYTWFQSKPLGLQMTRQNVTTQIVKKKFGEIINRHLTTHSLRATAQNKWKFQYNYDDTFIQLCFGIVDIRTIQKHYRTLDKATGEQYLLNRIKEKNKLENN